MRPNRTRVRIGMAPATAMRNSGGRLGHETLGAGARSTLVQWVGDQHRPVGVASVVRLETERQESPRSGT